MRASIPFLALALMASCADSTALGPAPHDAGTGGGQGTQWRPPDAGVQDAGLPAPDAGGFVLDAGVLEGDAGTPALDAGAPPEDAGTTDAGEALDAGTSSPDAGIDSPEDAGTVTDAGVLAVGLPDAGPCTPLQGSVTSLTRGHYCVTGDVIIPTGVTLQVPPGTTFTVMGRYHFGRDPSWPDAEPPAVAGSGSLHAIGTAAEPIVFRGASADTRWYGIVISHSHDTVHLEYVTIRDTYKDDTNPSVRIWRRGGGLGSYVNARGTIIRHCTFINNRASSVAGALDINSHGTWPNQGPVEITHTRFENNFCECRLYSGASADFCGGGAIRFSHVGGDANLVKIRDNVFVGNEARRTGTIDAYGGAIGGFDDGLIIGPGNIFDSNHAGTADGALSCNHQPMLGTIIKEVDPSVIFAHNTPDNGCGK